MLVTYGARVLAAPPSADPYGQRYKGIWCSLMVLTRALGGSYVNFGVFELYGDPALKVRTSEPRAPRPGASCELRGAGGRRVGAVRALPRSCVAQCILCR